MDFKERLEKITQQMELTGQQSAASNPQGALTPKEPEQALPENQDQALIDMMAFLDLEGRLEEVNVNVWSGLGQITTRLVPSFARGALRGDVRLRTELSRLRPVKNPVYETRTVHRFGRHLVPGTGTTNPEGWQTYPKYQWGWEQKNVLN